MASKFPCVNNHPRQALFPCGNGAVAGMPFICGFTTPTLLSCKQTDMRRVIQAGRPGQPHSPHIAEDYQNEAPSPQFAATLAQPLRRHPCCTSGHGASQHGCQRRLLAAPRRLRLAATDQAGAEGRPPGRALSESTVGPEADSTTKCTTVEGSIEDLLWCTESIGARRTLGRVLA